MELTLEQKQLIGNTKYLIGELQNIQNVYFDTLVNELDISENGADWLFDYIFNSGHPITFEEYLLDYDKNLNSIFND